MSSELESKPLAELRDGFRTAPRSVRPLIDSDSPVLTRRARVARYQVNVEMGNMVSQHEAVDVICAFGLSKSSR
jgi:hypothetical protein